MKKYSIALSILFSVTSILEAQNYFPFPTDSARWKVTYTSGALGCPPIVAEYQYTIEGDTIISSNTYKKIFRTGYTNNTFCYSDSFGYVGCIREDGNKHIYLRSPSSSSDTLLYDFNLSVGDTVKSYLNYCTDPITVISIDSILIQSTYRKRFNLDGLTCGANGVSLIEGIGSTRGLLDRTAAFESAGTLDCFTLFGQTIFPDTTTVCQLITYISPANKENCFIQIINNGDFYQVEFISDINMCSYNFLEVYNSLGQLVRHFPITDEHSIVLSVNELGSGLFFAKFYDKSGNSTTLKFAFVYSQ